MRTPLISQLIASCSLSATASPRVIPLFVLSRALSPSSFSPFLSPSQYRPSSSPSSLLLLPYTSRPQRHLPPRPPSSVDYSNDRVPPPQRRSSSEPPRRLGLLCPAVGASTPSIPPAAPSLRPRRSSPHRRTLSSQHQRLLPHASPLSNATIHGRPGLSSLVRRRCRVAPSCLGSAGVPPLRQVFFSAACAIFTRPPPLTSSLLLRRFLPPALPSPPPELHQRRPNPAPTPAP